MRIELQKIGFLLMLVAASAVANSQLPAIKVEVIDESEGFKRGTINGILQDSKGFIWFATADGLMRYDGYDFKKTAIKTLSTTPFVSSFITSIAEDKLGNLWVGYLKGGVSTFNTNTGKTRHYQLRSQNGQDLSASRINTIFIDSRGRTWLGVQEKGLVHLDPVSGACKTIPIIGSNTALYSAEVARIYNKVYAIAEDQDENLWLGTHDGLYTLNPKTHELKDVRMPNAVPGQFRNDLFNSVLLIGNNVWLSSWAGGISCYNRLNGEWKTFKYDVKGARKETANIVSKLMPWGKDSFLVGTLDKGLMTFNQKTGQFSPVATATNSNEDFHFTFCYTVASDRTGNLWISSDKGLLKLRMQRSIFLFNKVNVRQTDNGQLYKVTKLYDDDRYTMIGTSFADGVHIVDKKNRTENNHTYEKIQGEENFNITRDILKDRKGNYWILSRDYIYTYDEKNSKLARPLQPPRFGESKSNIYTRMIEDSAGHLWIATERNGIFKYNPSNQSYTHFHRGSNDNTRRIPSNIVTAVMSDRYKRIWIGFADGLPGYIDPATSTYQELETPLDSQELFSYSILNYRDEEIWIATDGGILRIDISKSSPGLKKLYTEKDGLKGSLASSLAQDRQGNIWCLLPTSIARINPADHRITNFSGLREFYFSGSERLATLSNGNLAITSVAGYITFDPHILARPDSNSKLVITSFRVNDKEEFISNRMKKDSVLFLSYNENHFSFEFADLNYAPHDAPRFFYKLEGFDKDWIEGGNKRLASYTNVPGGNYTFRLRSDLQMDDSSSLLTVPIYVDTVFYERSWFIILCIILGAIALHSAYRSRIKHQEKLLLLKSKTNVLEKEKAQVMYENLKQQLNPHFLFNSLTSLSSLIRLNPLVAAEFLDNLSKTYRYILKSRDRETVSVGEEVKFAENYAQLQKTRFEKGLIVEFAIDAEHLNRQVVPVTLQNMMENCIKHNIIDEESPLTIRIYTERDYLLVENNLQRKSFVEGSNQQGLQSLKSLYRYLSDRPVEISETENSFCVRIPLL